MGLLEVTESIDYVFLFVISGIKFLVSTSSQVQRFKRLVVLNVKNSSQQFDSLKTIVKSNITTCTLEITVFHKVIHLLIVQLNLQRRDFTYFGF